MLKLHTSDGVTTRIDLEDEGAARELIARLRDANYQLGISGASLVRSYAARGRCPSCDRACRLVCTSCEPGGPAAKAEMSVQYSVSRPLGFKRVSYHAEAIARDSEGSKGGERAVLTADDVRLTVTVHHSQPSVRIVLVRTGHQRYNPRDDTE